jgi:hypothetical protein
LLGAVAEVVQILVVRRGVRALIHVVSLSLKPIKGLFGTVRAIAGISRAVEKYVYATTNVVRDEINIRADKKKNPWSRTDAEPGQEVAAWSTWRLACCTGRASYSLPIGQ